MLTEKELYNKLKILEKSINLFNKNKLTGLNANEVNILKITFDTVKSMVKTPMPVKLTTSCSSCIKQAFSAYVDLYGKLKDKFDKPEPVETVVTTGQTESNNLNKNNKKKR